MKKITLYATQRDEMIDFYVLSELERKTLRFALFCEIADERRRLSRRYSDEELTALREVFNFIGEKYELPK